MKSRLKTEAFTIVEVMIVLAVTSLLLVSALIFISGQQQKTEFSQSVNDIRQQITDVINNISTGYYASNSKFKCSATTSGDQHPIIETGTDEQGAHTGCIFIGRAMHFGANGVGDKFNIYNLVGRQYKPGSSSQGVTKLVETRPIAFAESNSQPVPRPDTTEEKTLGFGLVAQQMTYDGIYKTGAVAFVTDFANQASAPLAGEGARNVLLYAIKNTDIDTYNDKDTVVDAIDFFDDTQPQEQDKLNFVKVSKVTICFMYDGTDQYGIVTIGSSNRQLSTELKITSRSDSSQAVKDACDV